MLLNLLANQSNYSDIINILIKFKHHRWDEEQEWRLITSFENDSTVRFLGGSKWLKPYVDLKYEKFQNKIQSFVREKQKTNSEINKTNTIPSFLKPVFIIIGLIIIFAIIKNANKDDEYKYTPSNQSSDYSTNTNENSEVSNSQNNEVEVVDEPKPYPFPVLPFPKHGAFNSNFKGKRIAPFEIKSESGGYYLLKLQNIYNANKFLTIFIQGGRNITLDIPLGEYYLKYAFGYKWYGYEHYFGEETAYSKADEIFDFKIVGEQVSGYTVTLYKVIGGNLNTISIEPEEF